jgi:hypothetical protein
MYSGVSLMCRSSDVDCMVRGRRIKRSLLRNSARARDSSSNRLESGGIIYFGGPSSTGFARHIHSFSTASGEQLRNGQGESWDECSRQNGVIRGRHRCAGVKERAFATMDDDVMRSESAIHYSRTPPRDGPDPDDEGWVTESRSARRR